MKKILLEITDELAAAIDAARGEAARNPWLESRLRRLSEIKRAAKAAGLEFSERPANGGIRDGAGRKSTCKNPGGKE